MFDADGTIIDAFDAIATTFGLHGMDIGDLDRFQKRRNLFKYFGGLKEFPKNILRQSTAQQRKGLITTLTSVYRETARLYPGVAGLIRTLQATPGIRVGMVTRNITHEPQETLRQLFARHDLDLAALDFFACIPLKMEKTWHFKQARERLGINPARALACGDEHKDYLACLAAGFHPLIVSYGFEDFQRLTGKWGVPEEVIAQSPDELCGRLRHTLDLPTAMRGIPPQPI
ncbi:HAD family hydrolase [Chitinilyticum piscinae]|uniref:HAD family hydrolase n=1 Tax=Chitinilyticum piscinae TaxID=2866724 RepID=A0A8J7KD02_9NEIS|nr:HAD family hydrolase [Chitinilyticum piscinae]MBE9608274.1 HAD family hydrolase [Chitinilyticum piscinae]